MGNQPSNPTAGGGAAAAPRHTSSHAEHLRNICLYSGKTSQMEKFLAHALAHPDTSEHVVASDAGGCCLPPRSSSSSSSSSSSKRSASPPVPLDVRTLTFEEGQTCLHLACRSGFLDICSFLIETAGTDINVQSAAMLTPIHLAVWYDHYDLVLYLISLRARLDLADAEGRLPLQYAQSHAVRDLVQRNMRAGEDDKNAIELGADYGYFTWTKTHAAADTFESTNPMRHVQHMSSSSSAKAGSAYSVSSSTSAATKHMAEAAETKEDFFTSAMDHEFTSDDNDDENDDDDDDDGSDIVAAPGVEDVANVPRSATASPVSVGPLPREHVASPASSLPPSRTPQTPTYSVSSMQRVGSGKYNAAFYTSLRKEGITSALSNRRMSGVSISAGTRHHNI